MNQLNVLRLNVEVNPLKTSSISKIENKRLPRN